MMTPTLLYLLKANAALLLFAAAYFGLLRRLTFFTLNRAYLVMALLFAAVYPALPVPALLPAAPSAPLVLAVVEAAAGPAAATAQPVAAIDWAAVALAVYAAGAAVLLVRLLGQLLSVRRLRRASRPATALGVPVRALAGEVSPFSFGPSIYLNPARHPAAELATVLRHEQAHVRQWHTLDVLLAQVALAAAWCNPAAWLLARALRDNLEYLADQAVLEAGLDRQTYQYSLLRLSRAPAGPALVSHFTFLTLKNRVAMMNTPLSSTGQLARYLVAGPLVLAVALGFSAARAQGGGPVVPAGVATATAAVLQPAGLEKNTAYYVDGHRTNMKAVSLEVYQNVATMKLLKGAQVRQVFGDAEPATQAIVIVTNRYRDRADVVALDQQVNAAGAQDTHFKMGPAVDPATHQLPDGIKAYIAQTYPNARITGWFITDKDLGKSPHIRYFASLDDGGQKRRLYFNGAEQPVTPVAKAAAEQILSSAVRNELVAPGAGAAPSPAQKPLAVAQQSQPPVYYVDGQLLNGNVNDINPKDIASVTVVKGDRARQLFNTSGGTGVIVITTKANENRADVAAFNAKLNFGNAPAEAAAAPEKPKPVAYLAPAALAYITKTYPGARLLGVAVVPAADGGAPRYQAEAVLGRRPVYLLFDAQGQFISDAHTSYVR